MVRVSPETFLAKVGELYSAARGEGESARKGSVVVSCKSVPASRMGSKEERERARAAPEEDRPVLLFRARQSGNNKHKRKYSTVVTAAEHGAFHAALSQLLKAAAAPAVAPSGGRARAAGKGDGKPKKASE